MDKEDEGEVGRGREKGKTEGTHLTDGRAVVQAA